MSFNSWVILIKKRAMSCLLLRASGASRLVAWGDPVGRLGLSCLSWQRFRFLSGWLWSYGFWQVFVSILSIRTSLFNEPKKCYVKLRWSSKRQKKPMGCLLHVSAAEALHSGQEPLVRLWKTQSWEVLTNGLGMWRSCLLWHSCGRLYFHQITDDHTIEVSDSQYFRSRESAQVAVHVGLGWVRAGLPGAASKLLKPWTWRFNLFPRFLYFHAEYFFPSWKLLEGRSLPGEIFVSGFSLAWLNGDTLLATGGGHLVEIGVGLMACSPVFLCVATTNTSWSKLWWCFSQRQNWQRPSYD